jgi:hypothetical protein
LVKKEQRERHGDRRKAVPSAPLIVAATSVMPASVRSSAASLTDWTMD